MSARRCRECGESVRKPHKSSCRTPRKDTGNFGDQPPELANPRVYALPPPSSRPDIAAQERTLLSFYRPAAGGES